MRRKKTQQKEFQALWRKAVGNVFSIIPPIRVTWVRHSCRIMDADNLAGAFKHVQDQLSREIGIDDGDPRVEFRYRQKQIPERKHYFTILLEEKVK